MHERTADQQTTEPGDKKSHVDRLHGHLFCNSLQSKFNVTLTAATQNYDVDLTIATRTVKSSASPW